MCILILLIFPVAKDCPNEQTCMFFTTAPEPLSYFVTPVLVAGRVIYYFEWGHPHEICKMVYIRVNLYFEFTIFQS